MDETHIDLNSKRADLLEKVRFGSIGKDEADQIAQTFGFSLLREPRADAVDIHQERYWNLGMVLAWISWRASNEVRWFWPKYVQQKQVWKISNDGGFIPGPATRWTAAILLAGYVWREAGTAHSMRIPKGFPDPAEAKVRLWDAVGEGHLTALAFDHSQRTDVILGNSEWRVLDLALLPTSEEDMLRIAPNEPHLSHVMFERQQVLKLWPSGDRPSEVYPTENPQIKFRFLSPNSIIEVRPEPTNSSDISFSAPAKAVAATQVVRKAPISQTNRRTRRPSPQQNAVTYWYDQQSEIDVEAMSDQRVADAVSTWAGQAENRERCMLGRAPTIDKSTVRLLRNKGKLP